MNISDNLKTCTVWFYTVVAEERNVAKPGDYSTYGIQIITPGYTDVLHNVSVYKKTAERIVEFLNYYHISPTHLYSIITDILKWSFAVRPSDLRSTLN